MSLIQVEHLTFAYPGSYDNVFEDVSFQIDTDWKLGLLGRNGRGKTTFLRLLQGEYLYEGRISPPGLCAYFPPPVTNPEAMTLEVLCGLCPAAEEWELLRETGLLGVEAEALYRPFGTLSNGERTKCLLAALFCGEERYLLIDEPTNHLDAAGRRAVAAYLRGKRGFLLVSHDRDFLDGCVDHILALNRTGAEVQNGTFSSWWQNKECRDAFERAENERLRGEIKRLEQSAEERRRKADAVERAKTGISSQGIVKHGLRPYLGEKSRKGQQQRKNMDRRAERAVAEKSSLLKDLEKTEALKLHPLTARGVAAEPAGYEPLLWGQAGLWASDLSDRAGRASGHPRRQRQRQVLIAESAVRPGHRLYRNIDQAIGPDGILCAPGYFPSAGKPAGLCPGERRGRDAATGDSAEAGFSAGAV